MSDDEEKNKALDDLIYGLTPETRLLNGVCAVATKEGKFSQFSMTNSDNGWKCIEFWWKPNELSEVELSMNI